MAVQLLELEREVARRLETVRDDPHGRYQLRCDFYRKYRFGEGEYGYGFSELAFLQWEVARGVLNPLDAAVRPGSAWWRGVNEALIRACELARLMHEAGLNDDTVSQPVQCWLAYLRKPSSSSWWRAHNASVVSGYLSQAAAAEKESPCEQVFLNMVLYRILFAQSMVEDASLFGRLGRLIADPALFTVKYMANCPCIYPSIYPLTDDHVISLLHHGHVVEMDTVIVLDDGLILPQLANLYDRAATWLDVPALAGLVAKGQPIYPALEAPGPWAHASRHQSAPEMQIASEVDREAGRTDAAIDRVSIRLAAAVKPWLFVLDVLAAVGRNAVGQWFRWTRGSVRKHPRPSSRA